MGEHTDDGIGAPGDNWFRGEHDAGSDFQDRATKVGEPDASNEQDRFVCQGQRKHNEQPQNVKQVQRGECFGAGLGRDSCGAEGSGFGGGRKGSGCRAGELKDSGWGLVGSLRRVRKLHEPSINAGAACAGVNGERGAKAFGV
jgi:hypothetical protein